MQKPQIKICLFVLTIIVLTGCTNPFPTSTKASSSTVATTTSPIDSTPITSPTPTPTSSPTSSPASTPTLNIKPSGSVALTDNEVKDILNQIIPKAVRIYSVFNGIGALKFDVTKTIPGDKEYCLVTGENFKMGLFDNVKSMADFKNVIEGVFTKDIAQKLFYRNYLEIVDDGKKRPMYKDYEGQLYIYKGAGGHGWAEKFLIDTAKLKGQKDNVAEIELEKTTLDLPAEKLTISIEYVNGKWLMVSPLV